MKSLTLLGALFLGAITSNADTAFQPGRWTVVSRGHGIGGGNMIVTPGGAVSGKGFIQNGGLIRYRGEINKDGSYRIVEIGKGHKEVYEGFLERSAYLKFSKRFIAQKAYGTKVGAYEGTYTGGYPWFFVIEGNKVFARILVGNKYEQFNGTIFGPNFSVSGAGLKLTGVLRGGKMKGEMIDGRDKKFIFRATLMD